MNGPSWAKHYRGTYSERSGDPRLPRWLRVACIALANHRANGHARFLNGSKTGPGDLALILAEPDPVTGEVIPATRHAVHRAIDSAVRYGWLAPGSSPTCLIVPAHAASYGIGDPNEPCTVDHTRARAKHDRHRHEDAVA